jgi:hypothetical protein
MRSAIARSTVLPKTNGLRAARGGSGRDQTEFVRLTTPSRAAQTELASARRRESRRQRDGYQLTARNLDGCQRQNLHFPRQTLHSLRQNSRKSAAWHACFVAIDRSRHWCSPRNQGDHRLRGFPRDWPSSCIRITDGPRALPETAQGLIKTNKRER